MEHHYRHFNARETVAAAKGYEAFLGRGGKMLVSLAGAMSTGELGIILSRMIREEKVHAISCTGANLEEDVFNLVAHNEYKIVPDWRALSADMEKELFEQGFNRVTDTCIPETVMKNLEGRLLERWRKASKNGVRQLPAQYLFDILRSGELKPYYQIDPRHSWMLAAAEANLPVWAPGWEDSTTGNMFAAHVMKGDLPNHDCVLPGTAQFAGVTTWYLEHCGYQGKGSGVGFFQIGGGIPGDFAICVTPSLIVDHGIEDIPFWGYFCQISDAMTSYGGYSGAVPNEKITWAKLDKDTPKYMIQSDASIVAPLIFAYVLND
ncbi:MAG: deoxyhypusine synthase family protein [Planctomycetota bacterium]|nr:deoxyhypusine synthase family protein [Planctomycetota bacterium]